MRFKWVYLCYTRDGVTMCIQWWHWRKMPVKQIVNWTVFGEVHTATTTFIACSTRFHLVSHPVKNLHRIPTNPRGFITVPISIPTHTTVLPNRQHVVEPLASYRVLLLQGTKVCRYNWHIAGSLGWPFSNYEYIFRQLYESCFIKQHSGTVMVWNYQNADCCLRKKL